VSLTTDSRGVLVRCPSCGRTNRLGHAHLDRRLRCGTCHVELPAPAEPIVVADVAVFDSLVARSPLPLVVDFWAPWCSPCRWMAPELEKAATHVAGSALIVKVDIDAVPALGERFHIRSVPTLAVFRGGREVSRSAGAKSAPDIEALVHGT
jgi:thioredoxin 2